MPRKQLRMTAKDVQKSRAEWWEFHYEKRAKFKALNTNEQHAYQTASMRISPPTMTVYGGLPESWPTTEDYRALAHVQDVEDTDMACPWYVNNAGWQLFNDLWQELPEPTDLYTDNATILIANRTEVEPSSRV